jgi:hypothetical protein
MAQKSHHFPSDSVDSIRSKWFGMACTEAGFAYVAANPPARLLNRIRHSRFIFLREERMIEAGTKAPDFCLTADDDNTLCLHDLRGMWVVLYFYPKDNTSG